MNPSTGDKAQQLKVAAVANGDEFCFDPEAVCAEMRRAQEGWAATTVSERLQVIRRFRHLLVEHAEAVAQSAMAPNHRALAEILTAEVIPLADACRFLERRAEKILSPRHVGRWGRPLWLGGVSSDIRREPFGLVLIIAPSNYPLLLPGVQTLHALVAGNAVLLKPGADGSRAARVFGRLLQTAGLAASLVQILSENPDAGQTAIRAGVDKIFFTGSAVTGAQILAQLAPRTVPSTMELSGCDAVIVRADADLDLAVCALTFGLRLNSGQTCIAPRRVFVARSVATEFEGRLTQAFARCTPVSFSPAQRERLSPLLHQALHSGAHLLAGKILPDRQLVGPMVLAGIKPPLPLLTEDIFAPLLMVVTVADDDEAVAFANDCPYALGATIFSRDHAAIHSLTSRLNVGLVLVNDMIAPTADARLPFGGRKLSGFGVTRGPEGLLEMTQTKVITHRSGDWRPHFDELRDNDADLFKAYLMAAHGSGWRARLKAMKKMLSAAWQRKEKSP